MNDTREDMHTSISTAWKDAIYSIVVKDESPLNEIDPSVLNMIVGYVIGLDDRRIQTRRDKDIVIGFTKLVNELLNTRGFSVTSLAESGHLAPVFKFVKTIDKKAQEEAEANDTANDLESLAAARV